MTDNSQKAIGAWVADLIDRAKLEDKQKVRAAMVANRIMAHGGWRGNISDALRENGFTNEQFNFELYD